MMCTEILLLSDKRCNSIRTQGPSAFRQTPGQDGTCTKHLAIGAKVVAVHDFENGIVKVQDGGSKGLTTAESRALARFTQTETDLGEDEAGGALGFADAARHERRVSAEPQYGDSAWIMPTYDDVEKLFSQAGMVYSDQRMSMLPGTLELFLRFNRSLSLWNDVSVAQVLRRQEQWRKRKRQLTLFEESGISIICLRK